VKKLALVAAGGVLGSLLRYLVGEVLPNYPIAILIVNLMGVAVAGWVAYRITWGENWRIFLIPGLAGGMTTFSSVALLHAQHSSLLAIGYFYGMIVASILILFLIRPKVKR
jgi:fluoride ion exporter CrcB/FEX